MCGICGIVYQDTKRPVTEELINAMAESIRHRGPDDAGAYIDGNIGLAHRRLSIIDLASGHQPMFNEDRSLSIVFNGEIYNHHGLRDELEKRGHHYTTKSDTETILHAYEEYGVKCLDKLRGMFAFAIYDSSRRVLFLARDRVGKKPLYFYHDQQRFVFASEVKAILKAGPIEKQVNREMIDFYLSIGYVPGRETLFKNIAKLEPGHYLILDSNNGITIKEYWDIRDIQVKNVPYQDAYARLKNKLLESIDIRLMSEVPLGVFLSGGLDSSAIVALMSQIVSQPIKTFSVGYQNEPQSNELDYARIVAGKFKTEHYEFFLTADDLFDSIDTFLEHSEEPIVESAGIALYKLAKLAKPKATVLLSGEGADELLAGYRIYPKMLGLDRVHGIASLIPGWIISKIMADQAIPEKAVKYLDWAKTPFSERYKSLSYELSDTLKHRLYAVGFRESLRNGFEDYFTALHKKINGSNLRKMLYIDSKTWLAEDILLKADRMTMAASIELRAPFLDHELMELAFSLPDNFKLRGDQGKFILKDIMKDLLPKEIVYRKKKGFPVPLTSWFGGALQARAKNLLTSEKALKRGYFNPDYIHELFSRISRGEDLGKRIFSLVALELWHQKYID